MHELSIAISIVDGVLDEAKRRGGLRVETIRIRVGRLAGVDTEALLFAYEVARQGTPLESSNLRIEQVHTVIFCTLCGAERRVERDMVCPECGSVATRVLQGEELEITGLEVAA